MKKIILFFLILLFAGCQSTKIVNTKLSGPEDIQVIIKQIVLQFSEFGRKGRPQRLAVLTFSSSWQQSNKENIFGNYFSEALVSELIIHKKHFKLFERKRLDAIMQENALSLSGLINEEQALKLGELAPLDVILSGTYTKLKNYIEINCRLIDVVSGEILATYNGRIILTEDLASLFKKPKAPVKIVDVEKTDPCKSSNEAIKKGLNDISSPDKIAALIEKAINIPFDMNCGKIHFDIIYYFERYKIYDEKYRTFLFSSMAQIEFPSKDGRAAKILDYFSRDKETNQQEWEAGLQVVQKSKAMYMENYLKYLLLPGRAVNKDISVTYKRIDEFLNLVSDKKVGLPVPVTFEFAYFRLIDLFTPFNFSEETVMPLIYLFEKYNHKIAGKKREDFYKYYSPVYKKTKNIKHKDEIFEIIISYFNSHKPDEKLGEQMFDFIKDFQSNKKDNPDKYPEKDFKKYLKSCEKLLSKALAFTDIRSIKQERILFCLENNISCPGLVPTINECIADIKSDDSYKRNDAAFHLSKMGAKAKPAEAVILTFIKYRERRYFTGSNEFLKHVISILGNIKTNEPKALNMLVQCLTNKGYGIPDKAKTALEQIGKPALPYLLKGLKNLEDYGKISAIDLMGKLGKDAKSAVAPIKKLYKETYNTWVKDAIEDALEKIE